MYNYFRYLLLTLIYGSINVTIYHIITLFLYMIQYIFCRRTLININMIEYYASTSIDSYINTFAWITSDFIFKYITNDFSNINGDYDNFRYALGIMLIYLYNIIFNPVVRYIYGKTYNNTETEKENIRHKMFVSTMAINVCMYSVVGFTLILLYKVK